MTQDPIRFRPVWYLVMLHLFIPVYFLASRRTSIIRGETISYESLLWTVVWGIVIGLIFFMSGYFYHTVVASEVGITGPIDEWSWGRITIPYDKIDVVNSRKQKLTGRLRNRHVLQSTDGKRIRFVMGGAQFNRLLAIVESKQSAIAVQH